MKKFVKLFSVLLAIALIVSVATLIVSGAGESETTDAIPEKTEIIEDSLVMKVNSGNSLLRGVKTALSGEPYMEEKVVMIPLDAVESYTGKAPASGYTSAVKNGVTYISMNDVEASFSGFYVTYDEVGLIFIAKYDEFLERSSDELLMHETAKRFIYTGTEYFSNFEGMLNPNLGNSSIRNYIDGFNFTSFINLVSTGTNNFRHPFILADQNKFNELNAAYKMSPDDADYDSELAWYIETQIEYADSYLAKYANLDSNGDYLSLKEGQWVYDSQGMASWVTTKATGNHSVSQMPYTEGYSSSSDTGYGYDPAGGRLNVLSDGEGCLVAALEPAALAYQITRDAKYLEFAYDWMYALCQWDHWGPGHFLNCANTSRPLATAYDWLYNDFVEANKNVAYLAQRIYENGVYEATVSLTNRGPEHKRISGDSSRYWKHVGNWNSCGTLGMLIASLAVMEHEAYRQDAAYVIAASLGNYMDHGMTYITFDGGYRESAGYWGSVRFMHFITKILMDTTGTDFGLRDFPGIDITDYFGCQLEGSDYDRWNYHDDWNGTQPSYWYYLSADLYDNPDYAAIRYMQVHSGHENKAPFRYDVLFYDKELVDTIKSSEFELPLDYVMTGIDAMVTRDSWDSGSLYAGIMGGRNHVAHGQYDSGNWIYENAGIRWFVDLGADDYNLAGGGRDLGYYKYSAEGNNTLALESLSHGQTYAKEMDTTGEYDVDGGELVASGSNQYGSYAIIDQAGAYNGTYKELSLDSKGEPTSTWYDVTKVQYARRGMLFTNNRQTVVIQDEVKTVDNTKETFWWFAHYDASVVHAVVLSDDGRTAYMVGSDENGEVLRLRVALVSQNDSLKFEIMDTYTYVLDTPNGTDAKYASYWAQNNEKQTLESDRSRYMKLAVKAENVTELNMAVVIEMVGDGADEELPELGYKTLVSMSQWTINNAEKVQIPSSDELAYTVYYGDGTYENFYTSKLSVGLINTNTQKVRSNIEKVECHRTVIADMNMDMAVGDHLIINLNGNLLAQKGAFRIGASQYDTIQSGSLTVNGGGIWAIAGGSGFQCRYGVTLKMSNVTFENRRSYLVRDEGANIIFDNCDLFAARNVVQVVMVNEFTENDRHDLIFNNVDLEARKELFHYENTSTGRSYGEGEKARQILFYQLSNTYFMGDSSVYIGGPLVSYSNEAYIPGVHSFILSDGVKLNTNGLELPESGTYTNYDGTESTINYIVSYRMNMNMDDENDALDMGYPLYAGDESVMFSPDVHKYAIEASGDATLPYVVAKVKLPVCFYVYNNDGSINEYATNDISEALPQNELDNGVYKIILNKDCIVYKGAKLGSNQQLVIDLNDKTLTISQRIALGSSVSKPLDCTVIVKNGSIKKLSSNAFLCRLGSTLIFDGVAIDAKGEIAWDNGASLIAFNNCNVTASTKLIYSRFGAQFTGENGMKHEMVINNSTVSVATGLVEYGEGKDLVDFFDLYVTGNSKIDFAASYVISESHPSTFADVVWNVYIEKNSLMPYEDFGFPENTETATHNLYGCETVTLDEEYRVKSFVKFPNMKVVASGDHYTVEYVTIVVGVKSSLTLYSDFTVNFFIPVNNCPYDTVTINGVAHVIGEGTPTYEEGGVTYYKLSVRNIAADKAADDIVLVFAVGDYKETKTFTVIRYCQIILSDKKYESSHSFVASAVKYIASAYDYTSAARPEALVSVMSTTAYKGSVPDSMILPTTYTVDKGNISVALRTAQLDLGSSLRFRFNLKSSYTGTLTINGETFVVENGLHVGNDYINVSVRAFDMYDPEKFIVIGGVSSTGEVISGGYDVRAYLADVNMSDQKLKQLLTDFYTYCTETYSYKYGIPVDRPSWGDSSFTDVEI